MPDPMPAPEPEDTGGPTVSFDLNGSTAVVAATVGQPLLETLRDGLGIRSTRGTCGVGICGTCTVLLDGRAASACLLMTHQVADRSVVTSEGLVGDDGELDEVQAAFVANNAYQCSFCIPAMVLTVRAHLDRDPDATSEDVREALGGNLCRCGTYPEILAAVDELVRAPDDAGAQRPPSTADSAPTTVDRQDPR